MSKNKINKATKQYRDTLYSKYNATVMLAKGLLVVRHSDGFCNSFQLDTEAYRPPSRDDDVEPYGHSLEQRPIPCAKAAYRKSCC